MTPEEITAAAKKGTLEALADHRCSMFSPEQVVNLKDVAAVGGKVRKSIIGAIAAMIIVGVLSVASSALDVGSLVRGMIGGK